MGEVIRFIPKAELERARLIWEARAIYESIFPAAAPASEGTGFQRVIRWRETVVRNPEHDRPVKARAAPALAGALRDRNDLELLTGYVDDIPDSFAHQ